MTQYYDADGNPVEGVLSPEEAKTLQEKADQVEKLEEDLVLKEEQLSKFSDKEFNFSKLRETARRAKTEASSEEKEKAEKEMEKMMGKFSAQTKIMAQEIISLYERLDTQHEATVGKAKEDYISKLAGGDEKVKAKLEAQFKRLGGDKAKTPDEVAGFIREAKVLVESQGEKVNPLNSFVPSSGQQDYNTAKKSYADTPEGQSLAKELGLQTQVPEKK